jgi:DNA invertase Pin-like site-specific DNA recombinase
MAVIGYARVSTDGQTLDAQQAALKAADCTKIFAEKMSGTRADRPALAKAIAAIQADDVFVITKLDRLARSTKDLLNTLEAIKSRGAGFKVLDQPALDTTSIYGKLLFDILGAIGEFERGLIVARTTEGRRLAREKGVRFGRKHKLTKDQIAEALQRRNAGERLVDIARTFNVSHSMISRLPPMQPAAE